MYLSERIVFNENRPKLLNFKFTFFFVKENLASKKTDISLDPNFNFNKHQPEFSVFTKLGSHQIYFKPNVFFILFSCQLELWHTRSLHIHALPQFPAFFIPRILDIISAQLVLSFVFPRSRLSFIVVVVIWNADNVFLAVSHFPRFMLNFD